MWSTEQIARDYNVEPLYHDLRSEALRDYVEYFNLNPRSWRNREYLIAVLKRHYQTERNFAEQKLLEDEKRRALEAEEKVVQNEWRLRMGLLGVLLALVEAQRFTKFELIQMPEWFSQAGLLCYVFNPFAYAFVYAVLGRSRFSIPRIILDQILVFVGAVVLPAVYGPSTFSFSVGSVLLELFKFTSLGGGLPIIGPLLDRARGEDREVQRDIDLWMFVRMYLWSGYSVIALVVALVDKASQ
ncbi:hypothetical protein CKM354_000899800 [Cercospora kikuchii]|uniref:Uncharacterized protein n=1 Tax=Cercospora kikuchii TaxID=84275 RepID=A0A9P3CN72_9PEZI|nr:uncharacterized protein CKM354_000899800 [Cercospora kikuchii]GIZ45848.1 hypothetical protein CKM354_000899800 [Cercospora kikuchii]